MRVAPRIPHLAVAIAAAAVMAATLPAASGAEAATAEPDTPALEPAWSVPGMNAPYYMHAQPGAGVLVAGYSGGAVLAAADGVAWRYQDGTVTVSTAFGDITGDGVEDVVLGQWQTGVTVLDGADGTVVAHLPTPATPSGVAIGEATGDGQPDLYVVLTGSKDADTQVRLYDGAGFALRWAVDIGADEGQALNAEAGDLDGDGLAEVVFGTYDNAPHAHAFGPDGGERWSVGLGGTVSRVRIADDGRTVLATGTGSVLVALDGLTGAERWRMTATGSYSRLGVADLNDDGHDDPVWAVFGLTGIAAANQVHAVDGATGVPLWTRPTGHGAKALAVGDVDGDGAVEVGLGTQDNMGTQSQHLNAVHLLEGATGAPRWTRTFVGEQTSAVSDLVAADGDGDGIAELVAAPYTDVLLGLSGAGADAWTAPLGSSVVDVMATDVDGDGVDEVVSATGDFAVMARDAGTGSQRWRQHLGGDIFGVVPLPDGDGSDVLAIALSTLYRLDGRTGAVVWTRDLHGWGLAVLPIDPDDDGVADVLVSARLPRVLHGLGKLIADSLSGALALLDGATGEPRWLVETPGASVRLVAGDVDGDDVDDVVASGALVQSGIVAYDGATLATAPIPLWRHDAGAVATALQVQDGDVVAVLPGARAVLGIEGATGAATWRSEVDGDGMRLLGFGDADADGATDVILGAGIRGERLVAVSTVDGAVLFAHDLVAAGLRFPSAAIMADLTGDAAADLVVSGSGDTASLVVYDGSGLHGGLTPRRTFTGAQVRQIVPVSLGGSAAYAVAGPAGPPAVLALIGAPSPVTWQG